MRKKYVISRYSGTKKEIKFNVRVARYIARTVVDKGYIPVVPHIYFTQFLDDKRLYQRKIGMAMGIELLRECDSAIVVIVDGVISEGMEAEIKCAQQLGVTLRVVNYTKDELKKILRKHGV